MSAKLTFCHIDQHQLILIQGPDARKFLQGQVTCDIDKLTIDNNGSQTLLTSSLGTHCTHKGRIVFSFRALPIDEQTIALQVPTDMVEIATAALQKYIVFSKAEIINTHNYPLYGADGNEASTTLKQLLAIEDIPQTPNTALQTPRGTVLCLSEQRYELWFTEEQANTLQPALNTLLNEESRLTNTHWDWLNIMAGIPEIRQTSSGIFTPHAINLHTIDETISFQKGCYTGQEVVARMQYLGKLKRQMFLFTLELNDQVNLSEVKAGNPVFSKEKTQSVGEIVQCSQKENTLFLLISAAVEQVEKDNIYLDNTYTLPLVLSRQ